MPQNVENTTDISPKSSIGDILSALKASITGKGSDTNLFASLLAETGASMQPVETPKAERVEIKGDAVRADKMNNKDHTENDAARSIRDNDRKDDKAVHAEKDDVGKRTETELSTKELKKEDVAGEEQALAPQSKSDEDLEKTTSDDSLAQVSLAEEAKEVDSFEKTDAFISKLFVGEDAQKIDETAKSQKEEDVVDPEEMLGELEMAAALLQEHLQRMETLKASQTTAGTEDTSKLDSDIEKLNKALAQIADQMATLKEGREGIKLSEADTKLMQPSQGDGEAEGVWQKMIAELTQSSMTGKASTSSTSALEMKGNPLHEKPAEVAQPSPNASMIAQLATAAAHTTKNVSDIVPQAAQAQNTSTTSVVGAADAGRPVGSYDFASQLSAVRETKGGATGLPKAIEQVSVQLHKAVKDGKTEMTLNLKPAELGKVEVRLSFGDGKSVTGVVVADNQGALNMLQKDSDVLVRALQEAGLDADMNSMEFSLRDDGQNSGHAEGRKGKSSNDNMKFGVLGTDASEEDLFTSNSESYYIEPGRVNLRV